LLEGAPGAFKRSFQHLGYAAGGTGLLLCVLSCHTDDSEHGAFYGPHYCSVGLLPRRVERVAKVGPGHFTNAFESVRKSTTYLAEIFATVAPCCHECAVCKAIRQVTNGSGCVFIHGDFETAIHGERHIGTSVAIRDRKDIEGVHTVAVMVQELGSERQCFQ